uniref:Uncharacterized protein n=1 Tax=Kalanchoe fedtschenkoi TaxID=63787 RepID=A0A7N0UEB3_KALFE
MATAEVAAALLPEDEHTEELSGETATGGVSATTEAKEVVQVEEGEEDGDEEDENVAPEETGPEDSSAEKDVEVGDEDDDEEEDEE